MKNKENIPRLIITCLQLMLTAVFFQNAYSDKFVSGNVICIQNDMPLDSVRVASINCRTLTHTDKNGLFVLESPFNSNFRVKAAADSAGKYSVVININGQKKLLLTDGAKPPSIMIFDLHGRCLKQRIATQENVNFTQQELSPGIYLLKINGLPSIELLIYDHNSCSFNEGKYETALFNKLYPWPLGDTLVFYKTGYALVKISGGDILKNSLVRINKKKWIASDNHNHTVLTDGGYIQDSVLKHAFNEGGLGVFVNSEHGGMHSRDTSGLQMADDPYQKNAAPFGSGSSNVPRWYTLVNYSWPKISGQRKIYPDKILLQGLEWNCPGHEHASVGFISDDDQPDAISRFEYQFDADDSDTSIKKLKKINAYKHENAVKAVKWLQKNYRFSSYFFINHPSREFVGPYYIEHFRDFHNAGPDVFLGFEGMPGHHKNPMRGSYSHGADPRNRTWGGADHILAKVGGLWDALLGEGRHIRIIVNSDYHSNEYEFWPGVYEKTWTMFTDNNARGWLDGIRSGEVFIEHGDLISRLDFTIDDGIDCVSMGHDLYTETNNLLITIRFKSPAVNNHGDSVKLDHIDLISGSIKGIVDPADPLYNDPVNLTTKVIRRFSADNWTDENGYHIIRTKISCRQSAYFRLRGTNLAVGTPGEVDKQGNPAVDADDANTEEIAWHDLWFYSNPVFVYRR